jgi:hypothetical protein
MDTYKIVGPYRVCEREPGEVLTSEDLAVDGVRSSGNVNI